MTFIFPLIIYLIVGFIIINTLLIQDCDTYCIQEDTSFVVYFKQEVEPYFWGIVITMLIWPIYIMFHLVWTIQDHIPSLSKFSIRNFLIRILLFPFWFANRRNEL